MLNASNVCILMVNSWIVVPVYVGSTPAAHQTRSLMVEQVIHSDRNVGSTPAEFN